MVRYPSGVQNRPQNTPKDPFLALEMSCQADRFVISGWSQLVDTRAECFCSQDSWWYAVGLTGVDVSEAKIVHGREPPGIGFIRCGPIFVVNKKIQTHLPQLANLLHYGGYSNAVTWVFYPKTFIDNVPKSGHESVGMEN